MNSIRQWVTDWLTALLRPALDALRADLIQQVIQQGEALQRLSKAQDLQLRRDTRAELKRVGAAIGELQNRAVFTTQSPDDMRSLGDRLAIIEQTLMEAMEPRKPGNHITPDHEFGNKIRL